MILSRRDLLLAAGASLLPHSVAPILLENFGLVDCHFHIERDPKLALRQLANGVTCFRDPGAWFDQFDELKRIIAADGLGGPHMSLCGPHIDGENPAYPGDSVVARSPEEARR